jgi:pyruvate dehydrogenase E2 component (dihydrolipoamide acetyltransferase)
MATKLVMPRLGWTMEEGIFLEWNKQDGDWVEKGDALFSVEGDKAIQEVEAFASGILRVVPNGPQPDDVLKVGALVGYLVGAGEEIPSDGDGAHASSAASSVLSGAPASPMAESPTAIGVSSVLGRPIRTGRGPAASPRARRVAAELGLEWTLLEGSGRSGRITEKDVRAAAASPSLPDGRRTAITPMHRLVAARMALSARTTAPVTLMTEADATDLVAWRQQERAAAKTRGQVAPTYNDVLVKLCALGLEKYPELNAVWAERQIIYPDAIHIGLVTDAEAEVKVPVVRDAGRKSLKEIAADTRRLNKAVQSRKISAAELAGATFSIVNLGMHGIDAFTPIIDLPQCAVLGVGRIVLKPSVYQGQVVPRQMVSLSLSFDHRLADNGRAARFLNAVRLYIEQPQRWMGRV